MSVTFAVVRWVRGPFVRHALYQKLGKLKAERRVLREVRDELAMKQWAADWADVVAEIGRKSDEIEEVEGELAKW